METRRLISMVEFVKEIDHRVNTGELKEWKFVDCVRKYADFLSKPLQLGFFVPCDEDGNVLKKPIDSDYRDWDYQNQLEEEREQFQQAKERVLFIVPNLETDINELGKLIKGYTVELLTSDEGVELTPTALKQIGL